MVQSRKEQFKELWDFFGGHIRYINLTSRNNGYDDSEKVFDKYNIPVKYFRTEKHRKGEEYGRFKSHIKVIREAYYSGAKRVLIFEDDIVATKYLTPKYLKKAIKFMKKDKKWDLFYLGVMPNIISYSSSRTKYNNIYKLKGTCTYAYVVNRSAMKKLIDIES